MTVLLAVLAVAFAFSMGAHYTGACMGMPYALGAASAWRLLAVMAPLTLAGAALASHRVAHTVGYGLVDAPLSVTAEVVVVGVAFGLTSAFNRLRVPTSTIQILVFTVSGAALAAGAGVSWTTVGTLAIVWVTAPLVAVVVGYAGTRLADVLPAARRAAGNATDAQADGGDRPRGWVRALGPALLAVGAAASFTMGANDVANATGSLVGTDTFTPLVAGLVGGAGLAAGVLIWGRPLLERVAFEIVTVDRAMATAAQLAQAAVVLAAVAFGLFTSMNQALVGAMAGAGAARGRHTVHMHTLTGILRGWIVGPAAGLALGYAITRLVDLVTAPGTLG